jgi:hypothetical protein
LRFEATSGLGPTGHSWSVCTAGHAVDAAKALADTIATLKAGERQTLVIGMGHGTCTCEGAAFEYVFNVEHQLRDAGVRDLARVVYLTNEAELGDFGVDGMTFAQQGFETSSELWTASLFRERGVEAILGAHVQRVDEGVVTFETLDGQIHTLDFDFAMLLAAVRWGGARGIRPRRIGHHQPAVRAERVHEGGCRLHAQALRAVARRGLALDLRGAWFRQPLRRRDRLRAAASDLAAPDQRQRHPHRSVTTAHRYAVRRHGQDGGPDDPRPDCQGLHRTGSHRVDGAHGRRVRRLRRS